MTIPAQAGRLVSIVDEAVAAHGTDRPALIPVLAHVREHHHDLSDAAVQLISERLHLSPAVVQSVASFYSFLQTGPTGTHTIRVCRNLSCLMGGADELGAALSAEFKTQMGETSADGSLTLLWTSCLGQCDHAPAALVDAQPLSALDQIVQAVR